MNAVFKGFKSLGFPGAGESLPLPIMHIGTGKILTFSTGIMFKTLSKIYNLAK